MAGSIGPVACSFVRGDIPGPRQRVALWHVPGLNGYGAKRMGYGDAEFRLVAEFRDVPVSAELWKANIEAMQGRVVPIVNDFGIVYPYCLIVKLSPPRKQTRMLPGGQIIHVVRFEIDGVRK